MPLPVTLVEEELAEAATEPLVSITIVTYNSEKYIVRCLEAIERQTHRPREVVVVDNASVDSTRAHLEPLAGRYRLVWNSSNRGFAAAQNHAIRQTRGQLVLTLNPDVVLTPTFLEEAVRATSEVPWAGMFASKLLRADENLQPVRPPLLDSSGIVFTPELRHLDRGSNQPDRGQYEQMEYVLGPTAAAALYRREMIEDVAVNGEFFDEDFFAYREDADLAWRAQLLGWPCVYMPRAVGYHVRRVLPERRAELPPELNFHSVKNRFLMRIKNITPMLYARVFLPTTWRDLEVLGYVLLREHTSLPALTYVVKNFSRFLAKRRSIQARRRVPEEYLMKWFQAFPAAFPLEI